LNIFKNFNTVKNKSKNNLFNNYKNIIFEL